MNSKFPSLSRRRFLLFGGGTALSALFGGAYLTSACPLSDSGICVGPCAACIDFDHDGICDRIQDRPSAGFDPAIAARDGSPQSADASCVACPFGLVNDPYPGQCRYYVDANNNGLCDLSEADGCANETLERPVQPLQPQASDDASSPHSDEDVPCTACPFGLVDDPYPGQCRYYIDHNGNGLCDLSEPGSCADETLETPSQGQGRGQGGGQRRHGRRKDGQ